MEEKFELPQELIDGFREIAIMFKARERQSASMLPGFIATDERDIKYMDEAMDPLYDFVEPGSSTEGLLRKYLDHIASFSPETAKERMADLEDTLGYKTMIVFAAGILAKRLHSGQKDKGDNDYFSSHLLKVAQDGYGWKEKVAGFLHDTTEDCGLTADGVINRLNQVVDSITKEQKADYYNEDWWQPWMEDILPCPADETHPLTAEEQAELIETLNLLSHHTAPTRQEYIERLKGHHLAIKVKLNDLANNMDLSRIPNPTQKDKDRIARYEKERTRLHEMLWEDIPEDLQSQLEE